MQASQEELQTSVTTVPPDLHSTYPPSGYHMMADVWGVSPTLLNDVEMLKELLRSAIVKVGATLLKLEAVQFQPKGVTIVALLAESHASIHTYPDQGVLMADAFTCGSVDPAPLLDELVSSCKGSHHVSRRTARGEAPPCHVQEDIGPGLSRVWDLDEVVVQQRTAFQEVLIARTKQGLTLFCEHERQSSELTQMIYHEGQFVPAALLAAECRSVLIIGSSEGVVTQLAQWCGAERIIHVDIDRECVELCAQHLPYGYNPLDIQQYAQGTAKVQLLFADGLETVGQLKGNGETFDIVVLDLPDEQNEPDAQHNRLYEADFLHSINELLTPRGVVITQAGCASFWRNQTLLRTYRRFKGLFASTVYFEMTEQDWVWLIGCRDSIPDPVAQMQARLKTLPYTPQYIDNALLPAATVPPTGLRRLLNQVA